MLTITEILRKQGVVDKFVEFFGDGLSNLPLADRATISNMSPEFGSTCAIFPIDQETLRYLELTGRSAEQRALIEAYAKHQHLWRENGQRQADYTAVLELDLRSVEPSIAGPKRPQDRVPLRTAKQSYLASMKKMADERAQKNPAATGKADVNMDGKQFSVQDGNVLIAAITSCTNTSNPAVMLAAGLLARKARAKGITSKPWVKTSLAPGSRVVTDYLQKANLLDDLDAIGFYIVGYGCTTCIGNSGPLKPEISAAVKSSDLVGCAVLSGNRNFEGRVHPEIKMNYLASPPLVVAYALAGSMEVDINNDPLGIGKDGKPVYLQDIWPTQMEVQQHHELAGLSHVQEKLFTSVCRVTHNWNSIKIKESQLYHWDDHSTYVKHPPYFAGMSMQPNAIADIHGARVLALLGDSVTTDHISPAGDIAKNSAAAKYLMSLGVDPKISIRMAHDAAIMK